MKWLPIILRCALIGALFAAGSILLEPFWQSLTQVMWTIQEDDRVAWLVVVCAPAIIAVIFAQAFMEMRKLTHKMSRDDPDSKIERLEKRIKALEKNDTAG